MSSNRLAFAAVAVVCVAAAGGGGYLAMKQNVAPQPVAATAAPSGQAATPAPAPAAPATAAAPAAPVPETGARVSEAARPRAERAAAATEGRHDATSAARAPVEQRGRGASRAARECRVGPAGAAARSTPSRPARRRCRSLRRRRLRLIRMRRRRTTIRPTTSLPPAEPPEKIAEELTVPADSVIGLQTETTVSSDLARVEDRVEAKVTRDVRIGDAVAIPAGSRAVGSVTQVERGGKFKERARLGVRFHTLVLADGTRLPISTETIFRESEAPGNTAASKIGGASVGGAILGAILGGARGAAIGAAAGAGAGTAVVAAGDRNVATLPAGMPMTIRLLSPVTVTIDK